MGRLQAFSITHTLGDADHPKPRLPPTAPREHHRPPTCRSALPSGPGTLFVVAHRSALQGSPETRSTRADALAWGLSMSATGARLRRGPLRREPLGILFWFITDQAMPLARLRVGRGTLRRDRRLQLRPKRPRPHFVPTKSADQLLDTVHGVVVARSCDTR